MKEKATELILAVLEQSLSVEGRAQLWPDVQASLDTIADFAGMPATPLPQLRTKWLREMHEAILGRKLKRVLARKIASRSVSTGYLFSKCQKDQIP